MVTLGDIMALHEVGQNVPYLTGEEARALVGEIKRLREALVDAERREEWAWFSGATAMQAEIARRMVPSYDSGAPGAVRSVQPQELRNAFNQARSEKEQAP